MKWVFLISLTILLVTLPSVSAIEYEEIGDVQGYTKILVNGNEAFIKDNIKNQDQFLASDKIFYGSSLGSVNVKVFISDNNTLTSRKYKIGIDTNSIPIIVKKIAGVEIGIEGKSSTSFIYSVALDINSGLHEIEFELEFDPELVRFIEEFDIILYDEFENEILRLDPFLSGFDERKAIDIGSTHSAITSTYTHRVFNIDISNFNCADNNSLALGYHGTGGNPIEIDLNINGSCGVTTDANFSFREQGAIPANTGLTASDTNGYFIYSQNTSRASPLRDCDEVFLVCEDFEDLNNGDVQGQNGWTGDVIIDVITDAVCVGGGKCARGEGDGNFNNVQKNWTGGGNIVKGFISFKMRQSAGGFVSTHLHDTTTEEIRPVFMRNTGADDMGIFGDATTITFTENTPDDAWRSFESNFDSQDVNSTILDGSSAGETINHASSTWTQLNQVRLFMGDTTTAGEFDYWDDLIVHEVIDIAPDYTIGTLQIDESTDVNVISPNGGETFDNRLISTITIDFNVSHTDSNSLLVDINFSTSSTQGTGTVIINDINTDSATITCDDSDFSNSTKCSFSWDIDAVADNNFFILINVSAGTVSDFDASDATFEILTSIITITVRECDLHFGFAKFDGQYLYVALTGFDTNGSQLIQADLNVYNASKRLLINEPLTLLDTHLFFISNKKLDDIPDTIVIKASDCLILRVIT